MGKRGLIGAVVAIACLCAAGIAFAMSSAQPRADGALSVHLGLGGQCAQNWSPVRLCRRLEHSRLQAVVYRRGTDWDRILTAARDGMVNAPLPPGRYVIAFTWDGSGILSTRGWRPFEIVPGRRTTLAPIAPVKYALSVRPAG